MIERHYKWYKIAAEEYEIELAENGIGVVEVKGKKVCMTRHQNSWFAFAPKCPHAGGTLADGYIDLTGNIVCPVHRYKFSIKSGRNTSGEGFYLKTYPVELRSDGIYIGLDKGWIFDL